MAKPAQLANRKSVAHLVKTDPLMAGLVSRIGPLDFHARRLPPFQSLVHSIIHQQLSGQAAGTILARFKALFCNSEFPSPTEVLTADVNRLRSAGVSHPKANYIREIAQRTKDGCVPTLEQCDEMSDKELLETLTQIKGVGRWTAEMLLIFNLGRPDVLPVHDLGVRRGFQTTFNKRKPPEPEQLERYGDRWRPYRTTATLYLWRAADFLKEGEWGKGRSVPESRNR